ncbi:MAG: response regulator [Promethearchaeota archaeon]
MPISILLVEDNPDHQELILEALEEANMGENIIVKSDGELAWDFLNTLLESYKKNQRKNLPKIILLDINLPKLNGLELLKMIKQNPFLKIIPVVILTTSRNESDILEAYNNHANSYLSKPIDFDKFSRMIKSLTDYWCQTNTGLI